MRHFSPRDTARTTISAQQAAFRAGASRTVECRIDNLRRLARMIECEEGHLIRALKRDLGKSPAEAWVSELAPALAEIRLAVRKVRRWARPKRVRTELINLPARSLHYPEPFGVALLIGPWNYPVGLLLKPLVSALAAGNCAILKPSEYAPESANALARAIANHFDPGTVSVICGDSRTTQALMDAAPDMVFFTGGTKTGRAVMRQAARHVTPLVLELGGKNPCIVDQDIDLPTTARRIAWGKFFNAGQTCVAPDFVLVHRGIQRRLIAALGATIRQFYGPDPRESKCYGRIINRHHLKRLAGLLDGQKLLYGGTMAAADCFVAPTLVEPRSWESAVMNEEIFGPILPILPYSTLDEALQRLRSLPAPLAVYCFSRNRAWQQRIRSGTRSGTLCINGTMHAIMGKHLPFGGVGASGFGRYHGQAGFESFSRRRAELRKAFCCDLPYLYPPFRAPLAVIKRAVRFLLR
jgi:aldehyde dehydrogenase (NAD+)